MKTQITRTVPDYAATVGGDNSIRASYVNAIKQAKKYIYIENQYFRSPFMAQELANALKKNKKLVLIVVVEPDYITDREPEEAWKVGTPSSYWTSESFKIIQKVVPDFCLFFLQATDIIKGKRIFEPVNIHSKVMLIDDKWYTIGSANFNDRSFDYDGEINISVRDSTAYDFRKQIFSELLEEPCPNRMTDAIKLWYEHAIFNHKAWKAKRKPKSKVYPFKQKGPALPIVPRDWV